MDLGVLEVFSNLCDSMVVFRATVSGHSGMGWGWGSWRSFPTTVIVWFYLGPWSVDTVGWAGVEFWDLRCLSQP